MKILLFDLDGTLIDSKRDIVFCVNRALESQGFGKFPEARVADEIGRGSAYLFRRLLGPAAPGPLIDSLVDAFQDFYATHLLDHTRVYPGVAEALSHYRSLPKVIVTNKNQRFADRIAKATGLRARFEGVFGAEAFPTQKPDPGPILAICAKWGVRPSEAVVIGDSPFDVAAGRAAGARTVAATYGFSSRRLLAEDPPDDWIESAAGLIGLFPVPPGNRG